MSKPLQLTGKRSGRLVALSIFGKTIARGQNIWLCKCDCGAETTICATEFNRGDILSCGCLRDEMTSERFSTHRKVKTGEYVSWNSMKNRCYQKSNNRYDKYGGRGIIVCDRWLGKWGFENFLSDMGPRPTPNHSIDRYPNNDGNYEPGNCRWATISEQTRNRRSNRWFEYGGEKLVLTDWAKKLSLNVGTLQRRIKRGMSFCDAINYVPRGNKRQ